MDCPCPKAGGKTRKTPRPYGVAKGFKRRRREQIRATAGTRKSVKVAGEFNRDSTLSFAIAAVTKPKLHLRIRCCCFCLSLQPEAARRKFYLIYAVPQSHANKTDGRKNTSAVPSTREVEWDEKFAKFKRCSASWPDCIFFHFQIAENPNRPTGKNKG